jgi:glycosyltransferase involved in cell wall biosynthesis
VNVDGFPAETLGGERVSDRQLRVAHLIHGLGPGGAEQVLLTLADNAPSVGVQLSVMSLMPTAGHLHPERLRARGVPVSTLRLSSRWDARGLHRAVSAVAAQRPDLIHTHMKHADLVGAYVSWRLGVPMVSTLHVIEDQPGLAGRAKRRLAAAVRLRAAARSVAVSEAVRQWYLATFHADPRRVVTIRNGVAEPDRLAPDQRHRLRAELAGAGSSVDSLVLVAMVGIMRPGKGHDLAIEALTRLPVDLPICLVMVGDGELRPWLEEVVRKAGVDRRRIVFAGFRRDVPRLLQACDLQLHASAFDALPTALIEGLAAGIPAVSFRVGGVPEIVTSASGRLVDAGDVEALARAVAELARDEPLRRQLGKCGRRRYEAEFGAERWARRLRDLYDDVLAGRCE